MVHTGLRLRFLTDFIIGAIGKDTDLLGHKDDGITPMMMMMMMMMMMVVVVVATVVVIYCSPSNTGFKIMFSFQRMYQETVLLPA